MKRYSVRVAAPAASEIEAVYLYIREDSPMNAANWRLGLAEAAESLKTLPKRCGLAPENGSFEFEIRQLIYGTYRVLFTIRADEVVILHVRHGARERMNPDEVVPPGTT